MCQAMFLVPDKVNGTEEMACPLGADTRVSETNNKQEVGQPSSVSGGSREGEGDTKWRGGGGVQF